jgi:hypothetical protein
MKHREYNKNWISHKVLSEMSEANLTQFLTEQSVTIPFTNFALNDLHELAYANNLVQDFTTRGRKKKDFTKLDLLKLCQKLIREHDLDLIYNKTGIVNFTIGGHKNNDNKVRVATNCNNFSS